MHHPHVLTVRLTSRSSSSVVMRTAIVLSCSMTMRTINDVTLASCTLKITIRVLRILQFHDCIGFVGHCRWVPKLVTDNGGIFYAPVIGAYFTKAAIWLVQEDKTCKADTIANQSRCRWRGKLTHKYILITSILSFADLFFKDPEPHFFSNIWRFLFQKLSHT